MDLNESSIDLQQKTEEFLLFFISFMSTENIYGVSKTCALYEWLLRSSHKSNFLDFTIFNWRDFNSKVVTKFEQI